jgi:hypothetical protein
VTTNDPWASLNPSVDEKSINARRVDDIHPWSFYWGRDKKGSCLLVLRLDAAIPPPERLPTLKGLEVLFLTATDDARTRLIIRLLDGQLRDVFWRLCEDVLARASRGRSEAEALMISLTRLWKWHYLLRGGSSGLLSPDEQRGLVGELLVLEKYLLAHLQPAEAVNGWRGPLGAPQDFVVRGIGVECKANSGPTSDRVRISSEHQLSLTSLSRLFLHVCVLDPQTETSEGAFTVTDVAQRILSFLSGTNQVAHERFEALLAAAGFDFADDYSGFLWRGGERAIYEVISTFPRLTPDSIPEGVLQVKHTLLLTSCESFLTSPSALTGALQGSGNYVA